MNRLKIVYLEIDYFQIVYFSGKKSLEKHWKNTGNVGAGKNTWEKPKNCSNERQQFQSTISKMFGIFHLSWTPSLCLQSNLQSNLNELIASVSMQNCISRNLPASRTAVESLG